MFKTIMALLISLILVAITASAQSPERHIFKVTITRQDGNRIMQTGVKVNGYEGILTTLHGLVNYKAIAAENKHKKYAELNIVKIDFARDIALISNEQFAADESGLQVFQGTVHKSMQCRSMGHPYGIELTVRDDIKLATPTIVPLVSRIPQSDKRKYELRKSPLVDIQVIETRNDFGAGESGSPLLNQSNQVIGIHDGGFDNINISWFIPIAEIDLRPLTNKSQIFSHLTANPINFSHYYQLDIEPIIGTEIKNVSGLIESWYFSFKKMMLKYFTETNKTSFEALKYFDVSTLSSRMKNMIDVDCQKFSWVLTPFADEYYHELNEAVPVDFIPVNVEKLQSNRYLYTVYFRYSEPLFAYRGDQENELYVFTFENSENMEKDLKQGFFKEFRRANIHAEFILDEHMKLVDFKNMKLILSGEPFFQRN